MLIARASPLPMSLCIVAQGLLSSHSVCKACERQIVEEEARVVKGLMLMLKLQHKMQAASVYPVCIYDIDERLCLSGDWVTHLPLRHFQVLTSVFQPTHMQSASYCAGNKSNASCGKSLTEHSRLHVLTYTDNKSADGFTQYLIIANSAYKTNQNWLALLLVIEYG